MSISSKLFVIASGETNVYGSSYYWNLRTSSFKQVAYLILFTVAENVAHNLCCQIRAGDNSSTCTFTTEKSVTCTGRHVRIIYKSFSILFNCRRRPFRKLTFQPTYNVCSHSNTLTKLASTFKTLQNAIQIHLQSLPPLSRPFKMTVPAFWFTHIRFWWNVSTTAVNTWPCYRGQYMFFVNNNPLHRTAIFVFNTHAYYQFLFFIFNMQFLFFLVTHA